MYKRLFASAIIFGMAAIAPPVQAQVACADRDDIVTRLEGNFHEVQLATGLQANGVLVEIWASPGTGTWTIFLTSPDGTSCITSSGAELTIGLAKAATKGVAG